jgi:prolyl-tRNA synthetase
MFLRTSEFLWQEGHTAHADQADAMAETLRALEMYREFAETVLAMPVVAGEKPEHERFPGAVATYSIEAMMQDGKALQAGTSHYLGTSFAEAAGIRYQDKDGGHALAHTTSWGVSTRMIGGVIMTHGDDDGLRVPPAIAPWQVVIVPMLRDDDGDAAILDYCQSLMADLAAQSALGEPVRVHLDKRAGKSSGKRWEWLKKGAPFVVEIGGRDVAAGKVAAIRRDRLYKDDGKLATDFAERAEFVAGAGATLEAMQAQYFADAKARLEANIVRDLSDFAAIADYFTDTAVPGWAEVAWAKPTGPALDAVVERLKTLKLTMRNVPQGAAPVDAPCIFSGAPAVERILIGRAY